MSLEQAIEKLTASVETLTGVLVAMQAGNGKAAVALPAPESTTTRRGPGRPKSAAPAPAPAVDDSGLGDDGDLADDGGLGDEPAVTADAARKLVLEYRDKAIKQKGKDEGMASTRSLMKKFVGNLDEIKDDNAAAIHAAFTAEMLKLK